jgi:histidyl-tRNA synthetase
MGGGNTPASGFALYLDLLMDMVQSSKIAPGPVPKILVKMEPGTSRPGFAAAERLREAGYIVKLHLGGRGPMEIDWELDVHSKAPPLVLIDISGNKQFEFQTIEEVLQKIGS